MLLARRLVRACVSGKCEYVRPKCLFMCCMCQRPCPAQGDQLSPKRHWIMEPWMWVRMCLYAWEWEKETVARKKMRIYTYSNNNITLYASSSLNWFPIHIRICVWIFQAHNFRRFSFSFLTLSYSPKIVTVCLRILDSVGLWVCVARNVCVRNGVCVCERPFSKPSIYCAFLLALSHFRIFQTLTQYFPSRFVRDVL